MPQPPGIEAHRADTGSPEEDGAAGIRSRLRQRFDGGGWAGRVVAFMRRCCRMVLDWLIPPSCAVCGDELASEGGVLCGVCFGRLRFVYPPFCDACGLPVTQEEVAERGWLCGECEKTPPFWHRGRAAFLYDGEVRRLIMGLKYGNRSEHAATLAYFMARGGEDLFSREAVLVPVPVHRWRLWRRGYNQAALMANALSRRTGLTCYPDGLRRRFDTSSLAHLSRRGRRRQLRDAIRIQPRYRDGLRGRPVILVDDILTTGATAEACAKALLENGCLSVDILVAARVSLS